jgi:hypothetical protein
MEHTRTESGMLPDARDRSGVEGFVDTFALPSMLSGWALQSGRPEPLHIKVYAGSRDSHCPSSKRSARHRLDHIAEQLDRVGIENALTPRARCTHVFVLPSLY